MAHRELQTVEDVIDALGGGAVVARLTGKKSNNVWNWKSTNRFPAETFLVLSEELRAGKLTASPTLWGIAPADRAAQ